MKTIKARIMSGTIILVCAALLIVGGTSIVLNYNSTNQLLEQTLSEAAKLAAQRVEKELEAYSNVAYDAGSIARLADEKSTTDAKKSLIDQRAKSHGFERGNIIGVNGKSVFDGKDYSDREYFQMAMQGKASVSEPVLSKVTNKLAMIVAAPLWEGGIPDTKVVGCVYFAPPSDFLNNIVNSIKISDNGSAYIVDKDGFTIAHKDIKRVEDGENVEELAKNTPALQPLADIHAKMRAGETGFEPYTFSGVKKFSAYSPIAGSDGWSIAVNAPMSDFMGGLKTSIIVTIILMVVAFFVAVIIARRSAHAIDVPIKACAKRLAQLAEGDLTTPVPVINTKDETRQLAQSTETIVHTVSGIIKDLDYGLESLGDGDFTVDSKVKELYVGDFKSLAGSMYQIIGNLSNAISQISISSEQVASGSDQVSSGAQALSQGATEQASSIEELSATIQEMSGQIKQNAENAATANNNASIVEKEIENGDEQMKNLAKAMEEINASSGEIGKIIKTIEDIAFQTNILALNAAVEAARAGAAGKGFAVVADEVRNLASKSATAAKNTSELIVGSIAAVNKGSKMANATAEALDGITKGAQSINALVNEIAQASTEQANSMAQVTLGIEQISAVVQTNSATSEESAAASEELSGQAQMLKELVGKFKVNGSIETPEQSYSEEEENEISYTDNTSKY
ncbi:MAG: methyl-accepting chemotaxis protein [Oscillospiraceae bacterium]